ncbi:hypothetical protein MNV49_006552 [Pseudohyphozyma bogoriensis]|nr:hypothetical protein MNV49_006552 [Pseudohyphozyma bogoriensis]
MQRIAHQPASLVARHASRAVRPSLCSSTRLASTSSSSSSSSTYSAPVKPGQIPAYDEALAYLAADKQAKLKQLDELKKGKSQSKEVLLDLEINAWINDPEVRWKAANGSANPYTDISQNEAGEKMALSPSSFVLSLLFMQRVTQMNVTPDLLPSIVPLADVQLLVPNEEGVKEAIEPGVFVAPSLTTEGVDVKVQVFHPEEKLYTLLIVDPDVPDEARHSFTTYAHLLTPNIPLSATSTTLPSVPSLLPYVPPHPAQGTPYHRFTALLFVQPSSTPIDLSKKEITREGFNVREFVKEQELEAVGVSFWRAKWDKSVSEVYEKVLGVPEPRYGKAPKFDPYMYKPAKYE